MGKDIIKKIRDEGLQILNNSIWNGLLPGDNQICSNVHPMELIGYIKVDNCGFYRVYVMYRNNDPINSYSVYGKPEWCELIKKGSGIDSFINFIGTFDVFNIGFAKRGKYGTKYWFEEDIIKKKDTGEKYIIIDRNKYYFDIMQVDNKIFTRYSVDSNRLNGFELISNKFDLYIENIDDKSEGIGEFIDLDLGDDQYMKLYVNDIKNINNIDYYICTIMDGSNAIIYIPANLPIIVFK